MLSPDGGTFCAILKGLVLPPVLSDRCDAESVRKVKRIVSEFFEGENRFYVHNIELFTADVPEADFEIMLMKIEGKRATNGEIVVNTFMIGREDLERFSLTLLANSRLN